MLHAPAQPRALASAAWLRSSGLVHLRALHSLLKKESKRQLCKGIGVRPSSKRALVRFEGLGFEPQALISSTGADARPEREVKECSFTGKLNRSSFSCVTCTLNKSLGVS